MKSNCIIEEQETTINLFPAGISDNAEVYTSMPHIAKRLRKLYQSHKDQMKLNDDGYYVSATVPRSWIKIQPKRPNNMTEEQRQKTKERLAAARAAKQEEINNGTA